MRKTVKREKLKLNLVASTAKAVGVDEKVVERVIDFVCKDIHNQVLNHNEIELSGFGKFVFSKSKAKKKILYLQKKIAQHKDELFLLPYEDKKRETVEHHLKQNKIMLERINKKL